MLVGKTIIVTGAGRGIGRAIAAACAREGANVGINLRANRTAAEALAHELESQHGVSTYLLPFDVRDSKALAAQCQALFERGVRIDGWVNNAAVNLQGLLLSQALERPRLASWRWSSHYCDGTNRTPFTCWLGVRSI